jgi:hypothetical protein
MQFPRVLVVAHRGLDRAVIHELFEYVHRNAGVGVPLGVGVAECVGEIRDRSNGSRLPSASVPSPCRCGISATHSRIASLMYCDGMCGVPLVRVRAGNR